jgi:hypothetical protein
VRPLPHAWYELDFGATHNFWVAGDTLYMGAFNAGFRAIDISGELRGDLRAQGPRDRSCRPDVPERAGA